jgi:hypothetical protein
MPTSRSTLLLSLLLTACGDSGEPTTTASSGQPATEPTTSSSSEPTTTTTTTTTTSDSSSDATPTSGAMTSGGDEVAGLELLPRLAGLWSGPATMTPLGTFKLMNMDLRAASGQVLFARADLDALNSLRFAFEVEAPGGAPTLVYRNGGYFLGLLRDSRTALVEQGEDSWRFCSTGAQGCDYIDARWTFSGADALVFDVKVKGSQHVYWEATRKETRALPEPFPSDLTPLASDAEFPPMPTLKIDVGWAQPLAQDGEVWTIVTTGDCDLQLKCTHSRSLRAMVSAGATSASLTIEQIHPGPYKLNAILDRNGNLATTLYPDTGDGVASPNQAIMVAPSGETAVKAQIVVTL